MQELSTERSCIGYNGMQINTVKDMKEQILKIAKDLEQGTISENNAQTLLLGLFGVSNMLRRLNNHAKIYSYPSESFKQKLKRFISNYC